MGYKLPDTADAEAWPTPDIFLFEGRYYKVGPDGKVKRYRGPTGWLKAQEGGE